MGWTTVRSLSSRLSTRPKLCPDGGGDGAGNAEKDIDFHVSERGGWVPNLRGASPVGHDGEGRLHAARQTVEAD